MVVRWTGWEDGTFPVHVCGGAARLRPAPGTGFMTAEERRSAETFKDSNTSARSEIFVSSLIKVDKSITCGQIWHERLR